MVEYMKQKYDILKVTFYKIYILNKYDMSTFFMLSISELDWVVAKFITPSNLGENNNNKFCKI